MVRQTVHIREAVFPSDTTSLIEVIREYVRWLDMDLSYRGFESEMASFERVFTLPSGMFFIAEADGEIAGCAGLLRHTDETAEVKRLYVRERYRGRSLGEQLVSTVIKKSRLLGFSKLILDAVPQTKFAQKLYERMGFTETVPYYANPAEGTRFFEMRL
jgi:putative acetyltransferase